MLAAPTIRRALYSPLVTLQRDKVLALLQLAFQWWRQTWIEEKSCRATRLENISVLLKQVSKNHIRVLEFCSTPSFTSRETEAATSAHRLANSSNYVLTSSNTWLTSSGEPKFTIYFFNSMMALGT